MFRWDALAALVVVAMLSAALLVPSESELVAIEMQGSEAAMHDKPIEACPYHGAGRSAWCRGWHHGEARLKEERRRGKPEVAVP
jgi:hypothetical protein